MKKTQQNNWIVSVLTDAYSKQENIAHFYERHVDGLVERNSRPPSTQPIQCENTILFANIECIFATKRLVYNYFYWLL